jgi:hypothetical protein
VTVPPQGCASVSTAWPPEADDGAQARLTPRSAPSTHRAIAGPARHRPPGSRHRRRTAPSSGSLNAETCRDLRRLVHVDLDDPQGAGTIDSQLFERRRDRPARTAPRRPEIDEDGQRGTFDDPVEVGRADVDQPRQVGVARTATRAAAGVVGHPVPHPARRAFDHRLRHRSSVRRQCSSSAYCPGGGPTTHHGRHRTARTLLSLPPCPHDSGSAGPAARRRAPARRGHRNRTRWACGTWNRSLLYTYP